MAERNRESAVGRLKLLPRRIKVKIFLQLLILQEFVIITVMFSGVFLVTSYFVLSGTDKTIPAEMLGTGVTLLSGAIGAALKKKKLSGAEEEVRSIVAQQTLVDYVFMGATTTCFVAVFNYVYLVWIGRSIPVGMSLGIGGLVAAFLGFIDFGKNK
jgi:hypothetical protein